MRFGGAGHGGKPETMGELYQQAWQRVYALALKKEPEENSQQAKEQGKSAKVSRGPQAAPAAA